MSHLDKTKPITFILPAFTLDVLTILEVCVSYFVDFEKCLPRQRPSFQHSAKLECLPPISNLTLVALFIESLLFSADHSDNFWFSIDLHNCFTLRALALIFGIILVLFFQRPVSSSFLSLLSNIPKQIKKKKEIVIRKIEKTCFIENISFLFILN